MRLDLGAPRSRRAISLTPLIDVVFILLLFFMLSSQFLRLRQIELPMAAGVTSDTSTLRELRLLNDAGDVSVDGRTLAHEDQRALQAWIREEPAATLVVSASQGVRTQALVLLVDRLRMAGAARVSLRTDTEPGA